MDRKKQNLLGGHAVGPGGGDSDEESLFTTFSFAMGGIDDDEEGSDDGGAEKAAGVLGKRRRGGPIGCTSSEQCVCGAKRGKDPFPPRGLVCKKCVLIRPKVLGKNATAEQWKDWIPPFGNFGFSGPRLAGRLGLCSVPCRATWRLVACWRMQYAAYGVCPRRRRDRVVPPSVVTMRMCACLYLRFLLLSFF
jgi:hypothetical protein